MSQRVGQGCFVAQVYAASVRQDEGETAAVDERQFGMRQHCACCVLEDGAHVEESLPAREAVAATANKLPIRRE